MRCRNPGALRGVERTQISNLHARVRAIHAGRTGMTARDTLTAWAAKLRARLTRMHKLDEEIAAQLTEEPRSDQAGTTEQYTTMAEEAMAMVDEWLSGRSGGGTLQRGVSLRR